jgi:transposase InsO family protein
MDRSLLLILYDHGWEDSVCSHCSSNREVPLENGYIESFNGKFRDELLNGEIFDTVTEAKVVTERWRNYYNKIRPHSSLGYKPPASETFYSLQLANA